MKVTIIKNGDLKKIIGTKYFIVASSFLFLLDFFGKKYIIKVSKGFVTDFGSIPPIFFFFDKAGYASYIMHDYLYSFIGEITCINGKLKYDQMLADDILIAGLGNEGMNNPGKVLVLLGLSIGGRFNFKKIDKKISELKKVL